MFSKLNQSTWGKCSKLMILAVLCLVVLAACGKDKDNDVSLAFKDTESDVKVATYTDGEVTDKEFEKFKATLAFSQGMDKAMFDTAGYREYVLEQFVVYKHVAGLASDDVKAAAKEEATTQIQSFKDYLTQSNVDFNEMLTTYGVSEDDVKTFFYLGSVVSGHLESKITDEELSAEYEANLADYSTYDVRHILISNEVTDAEGNTTKTRTDEEMLAIAKEAKAKLDAGESWDAVAKQYSEDPGSKDNGGLYSATQGMNWEENFKQAAYKQEIGVIGEPFSSQFGYHVLLVEKRESKAFDQLDESVLDTLRYYLSNDKFSEIYDSSIESLNVQMNLPEIESPEGSAEGTTEGATEGTNEGATEEAPAATTQP